MSTHSTFDWALLRVVPRVERGEQINVGAILYCRTQRWLGAEVALDEARLRAIDPNADVEAIRGALALFPLVASGAEAGGPIARLPQADRFHWLTSPRSTIVQPSPLHTGLCDEPAAALERIMSTLVR